MHILYNNKVIAKLTVSDNDDLDLLYTDEWKQEGFALSPFLPFHEPIDKRDVKNFILNFRRK